VNLTIIPVIDLVTTARSLNLIRRTNELAVVSNFKSWLFLNCKHVQGTSREVGRVRAERTKEGTNERKESKAEKEVLASCLIPSKDSFGHVALSNM
jgi:hypothetical protein